MVTDSIGTSENRNWCSKRDFCALQNLGLVVIDEEHDQSYKQGESPRYQGRDVAVYRAFQEKQRSSWVRQLRLLNHGKTVRQESTIC